MSEPDYIVVRPAPSFRGTLPPRLDGWWYDRADFPEALPGQGIDAIVRYGGFVAVATGRFEVRDYDGAVAEVFEVRP
ncbi:MULTISPECIES: hypothetical protein [unclassified Streptomyces]|uniref:hypothetical protein n=1 Tax=unclassified Streptomyces TaxID=2593676 RepID=UPI00136D03CF|nr:MULTISPECIES: hypothetical protein [unclassified Streptomyces]NDZ98457.1 hypothetical protein [Streptomyces sp. SID10116]MYY79816.1 hypothetical protein [Streptomyces sp. SID335]MYZ16032.1 hypothetical protein [Streptomyces sp. SID337]NDZ84447.1 hypothetical protein [Streptomyces sp. SID10115]NEB43410.1 hypothetical protein [Streptomyces sp. SID339]